MSKATDYAYCVGNFGLALEENEQFTIENWNGRKGQVTDLFINIHLLSGEVFLSGSGHWINKDGSASRQTFSRERVNASELLAETKLAVQAKWSEIRAEITQVESLVYYR